MWTTSVMQRKSVAASPGAANLHLRLHMQAKKLQLWLQPDETNKLLARNKDAAKQQLRYTGAVQHSRQYPSTRQQQRCTRPS